MKLSVRHELLYTYSDRVLLTPHVLLLHPPTNAFLRLERFQLHVDPQPDKLVATIDAEGNDQHLLFHYQPTDHLRVVAEMDVETRLDNPFDFVFHPTESGRIPFQYSDHLKRVLQPYLVPQGITTLVEQFARQVASEAGWETLAFLTHLDEVMRRGFAYQIRETGPPMPPEHLLLERKGSCRDYVNLYMAACRVLGLASRFVSGYYFGSPKETQELHAWAEVYLPGGGWRGFDPTNNITVADAHIPLAASAIPKLVTPIAGTFTHRGPVQSEFEAQVSVRSLEPEAVF